MYVLFYGWFEQTSFIDKCPLNENKCKNGQQKNITTNTKVNPLLGKGQKHTKQERKCFMKMHHQYRCVKNVIRLRVTLPFAMKKNLGLTGKD